MTERGRGAWGRAARGSGLLALLAGSACPAGGTAPTQDSASLFERGPGAGPPPPGMVAIPAGKLLVGTPVGFVPRAPDVELPGVVVEVGAFFIDEYPHPNEVGALPTSNLDQAAARALCEEVGKRLCTEIELERACKGPGDHPYVTGRELDAEACGDGKAIAPNGLHTRCVSAFGVRDLFGSAGTWTSSSFGRGSDGLVTVKGAPAGTLPRDVAFRCAHATPRRPAQSDVGLGARCCRGPVNDLAMELPISVRASAPRYRPNDRPLQLAFEGEVKKLERVREVGAPAGRPGPSPAGFVVERVWEWHPLGNESLALAGGCSPDGERRRCGVFVARTLPDGLALLAFVSSERWQPTVGEGEEPRVFYVHGGDPIGAFRKRVAWNWGRAAMDRVDRKTKHEEWAPE
jgi:formylglycine-generating enzyme